MKQPREMGLLAHASWLRGLAVALARNGVDPDDVVQETWLAALRTPPDRDRPPRPWLSQVLRNAVRMAGRTSQRQRGREREAIAEVSAPDVAADELLERVQAQRRLAELVTSLEEPYRNAILLHYYEGRTAKDIARELGVPAGTIRWRITEGLARLRVHVDRENGGDRARSRAWLLAMAGPAHRRPPGPAGGAALTTVVGVAATLGVAVVFGLGMLGRPAPQALGDLSRARQEVSSDKKEDQMMKQTKVKAAAALFGVAVPALLASAQAGGRALSRDEHVAYCVERWEKMAACKDEFVTYFSNKVPPERRQAHREKFLKQLLEAGTGPIDERRDKCAQSVDRIQPVLTVSEVEKGRSCFAEADCKLVIACMKPLLDKAPAKKTAP